MDNLSKPTSQRERQMSSRALASAIQTREVELDRIWRKIRKELRDLESEKSTGEIDSSISEIDTRYKLYQDKWEELRDLYAQNDEYKEDTRLTENTVQEKCKFYDDTIEIIRAKMNTWAYDTKYETKSLLSNHSSILTSSAKSKGSNASSILKAQALAAASAANESAVFEEMIAQRTLEHKTQKAMQELERVKQEAAAEADLKILRARQMAAVEKARTEAILQAQEEDHKIFYTTPNQTSNDHVNKFLSSSAREETHSETGAHTPLLATNQGVPNNKHNKNPFYSQVPISNSSPILPQRSTTEDKLMDLTRHVTDILAQQRQPIHEPDVFKGDPLLFHPWRSSFEAMIGQASTSPMQKLTYLAKYTDGEVKELVDRYRHRYTAKPEIAYQELWIELERRFGNQSNVTSEIIRRIQSFPKIGPSNRKELQTLSDLCSGAAAQMAYLPGLSILNYPQTMYPILEKLPEHLHNNWRKEVSHNKLSCGLYPTFSQFTEFLRVKAQMYNDPDLYPCDDTPKPPKPPETPLSVMTTNRVTPSMSEQFCVFHKQQGHNTPECIALGRQSLEERREFCKIHGLCFKCGQNHLARDCDTEVRCKKCDSNRHASFMHTNERQERGIEKQESREIQTPQTEETNIKCTKFSTCSQARSCSKIVLVKLYHENNPSNWMHAYVVLDDQSNACLGDPKLFERLNINGPEHEYELSTCGGHRVTTRGRRASGVVIESLSGHKEKLPTIIENRNIPGDRKEIPTPDICQAYPHLRSITEYISQPREDVDIILLIGRNCPEPLKVRESRNGPRGTPWAQRTNLGWTISGQVCTSGVGGIVHATVNRTILESCTDPLGTSCENHIYAKDIISPKHMEDVYVETTGDDTKALSVEDRQFMKHMSEAAHTNALGNLEFPLPFKNGKRGLPNNFSQARIRLKNLIKSLERKPDVMKEYLTFMDKIISRGHASEASHYQTAPNAVWYLPHFAVHHPKKSGIRVVFDASAEFDGVSLNKVLLQGPDQMNSLLGILLRFRIGAVAVMGDIEQMFHNFYVDPTDRDFLRFLWFKDNDPSKPVIEYRMNVHLFGSVSSPAVATFGLRMIADACEASHGKDVTEFVNKDFYVDDGLTSATDAKIAVSLIKRSCSALSTKNLHFHKFVSNSEEVMQALPEEDKADGLKSVDLNREELPTQRSLGVHWNLETDAFTFKVCLPEKPFSRRGVLSIASSIYDPIGLVAPVSVEGKVLLRELMTEMKEDGNAASDTWDKPLPEKFRPKWARWRDSLYHLCKVNVPCCYTPADFGPIVRREVHVFSDASNIAIGAVAYLRQVDVEGNPHVSLLLAKAKLTPKHAVSIPRLELCAAVLAVSLGQIFQPELEGRLQIDSIRYYTDSKVVLGYISNESRRFHVYVANRVHKIHSMSDPCQWAHVPTNENPADLASRSVRADQLMNSLWFKGPKFLWQQSLLTSTIEPLMRGDQLPLDPNDPDVRKEVCSSATDVQGNGCEKANAANSKLGCDRFLRFSSWQSLRRAIANLIVMAKSFRSKKMQAPSDKLGEPSKSRMLPRQPAVDELQESQKIILKSVQEERFGREIDSLRSANNDKGPNQAFKQNNPLRKLNPFLDEEGLLRVGGRLRRADLDLGGRHPILLPKNSHVSRLIATHFHKNVQHQGRHISMGAVRSGGFWILGVHGLVRSIIDKCTTCKRLRAKPITQQMADLPKDRMETSPPFTNVGTDVFGPWTIVTRRTRGGSADSKRWAVIFTCLSSRAVHVEVIESMDTSSFIMALRRFMAIRGPIAKLRCDQGTNFIGAKSELEGSAGNLDQRCINQFLSSKGTEWLFNPPHASHFGGVWERQIKTLRRVLDSMFYQLGEHQLTHEVLVTFMAEAVAIVNSRPISFISSDANDPAPLTPNMLLTQKTNPLQPVADEFTRQDLYGRKRWRQVQYLADQFWVRWRKEYLQGLQSRQKWLHPQENVSTGDVVLLKDKDVVRGSWPLARVVKTYQSEDGKVRKVDVLVCTKGARRTFTRPISELVLIEGANTSS